MHKTITVLLLATLSILCPLIANAATSPYEQWQFRNGQVCVQTGGSTYWPIASATAAWNASDINVTYRVNCAAAGYLRRQTVLVAAYNDPADYACAKTASSGNDYSWEYVTYNGIKRAVWVPNQMTILVNHATERVAKCRATSDMRLHVLSHELGHAFGMAHTSDASVMASWAYKTPTKLDLDRANAHY